MERKEYTMADDKLVCPRCKSIDVAMWWGADEDGHPTVENCSCNQCHASTEIIDHCGLCEISSKCEYESEDDCAEFANQYRYEDFENEPLPQIYYFGRGSSDCIAVTKRGGNYVGMFIGNGKVSEQGKTILFDLYQLESLIEFFQAIRDDTMPQFIEKHRAAGVAPEAYIEKQ